MKMQQAIGRILVSIGVLISAPAQAATLWRGVSMQRVPRRRLLAALALLASLSLMAVTLPAIVGVASAQSICDSEAPPPQCVQPVAPCPHPVTEGGPPCVMAFSGTGSAATLSADSGFFTGPTFPSPFFG